MKALFRMICAKKVLDTFTILEEIFTQNANFEGNLVVAGACKCCFLIPRPLILFDIQKLLRDEIVSKSF